MSLEVFLSATADQLDAQVHGRLVPGKAWFRQGKSRQRYWEFVEEVTGRDWTAEEVDAAYRTLREPGDDREAIPASLRYEVLKRDGSRCRVCGRTPPEVAVDIDHIRPWSLGGTNSKSNLQVLCRECNQGKSNNTIG